MPNEEFIKWKRKQEDARARGRESIIYKDDADLPTKIFNVFSFILIILIIAFSVIVPLIGLLSDRVDIVW